MTAVAKISDARAWYNTAGAPPAPGSRILKAWNDGRAAEKARTIARARATESARAYAGANVSRLTGDWSALNTSGDSELLTSLRILRARSRELIRDNEYAKQAVRIIKSNVVGTGIGMQALVSNSRGKLVTPINNAIESAWSAWADRKQCHVAGLLGFADIERLIMGQLVEAGEVLVRKVNRSFGGSAVPFALEVIEADRLMDQYQSARAPNGNAIRLGVEVDEWYRPVAYWLHPRHPGDYQFSAFVPSKFIRVPAEEMMHLYIIDRWPQTRGEPWFHAALRTMNNLGGYEEAEIVAARASANIVGFIRSPEGQVPDTVVDGRRIIDTEPGTWQQLLPGEDISGFNPSRPNASLEPFVRYMIRKMAAGIGVSYESLSRDYSQSNYSSSRLALLDDRDLWRMLQGWIIRSFRAEVHRDWLDAAVMANAIPKIPGDYYTNPEKYRAVRFKPRGWSWIDPTKEVLAYKLAVRNGFMSQSDVIAQTAGGADIEDVLNTIRQDRDLAADLGLVFDSDPSQVSDKGQAQPTAIPVESAQPADPADQEVEKEAA